MNYEEVMVKIAMTDFALSRVAAEHKGHMLTVALCMGTLDTPTSREAVADAAGMKKVQRDTCPELFVSHLIVDDDTRDLLRTLDDAIATLKASKESAKSLLKQRKHIIRQLQVTSDNGVSIRALSIGKRKNTIMVSAKTAGMKHPVTRHLRKQGNVWTGKPLMDVGEAVFIQYHVTNNYVSEDAAQFAEYMHTMPIQDKAA